MVYDDVVYSFLWIFETMTLLSLCNLKCLIFTN